MGDIEIKREHTSVEWNPAIIRTIANIDGVSEQDKLKLFKLPLPPKANGVHLNAIAKKYKGSVAKRIEDAMEAEEDQDEVVIEEKYIEPAEGEMPL